MRNIKDCYRRLKIREDIIEEYDFFALTKNGCAIYNKGKSICKNHIKIYLSRGYSGKGCWSSRIIRRIK